LFAFSHWSLGRQATRKRNGPGADFFSAARQGARSAAKAVALRSVGTQRVGYRRESKAAIGVLGE
jgi:hypothetical protein